MSLLWLCWLYRMAADLTFLVERGVGEWGGGRLLQRFFALKSLCLGGLGGTLTTALLVQRQMHNGNFFPFSLNVSSARPKLTRSSGQTCKNSISSSQEEFVWKSQIDRFQHQPGMCVPYVCLSKRESDRYKHTGSAGLCT